MPLGRVNGDRLVDRPGGGRIWLVSTSRELERVLLWAFLGIRAVNLLQAGVGVATGTLATCPHPGLNLACLAAVVAESVLLGVWLWQRGDLHQDLRPVILDWCTAAGALVMAMFDTAPAERLGTWSIWAFAYTLSTATLLGAVVVSLSRALSASGALAGIYFAVVAIPSWHRPGFAASAAGNVIAYISFTLITWVFARVTRGLAELADRSRDLAADLERERAKATVHDLLPFLRLEHLLQASEQERTALVEQAEAKYRTMRDFVDGCEASGDLQSCLQEVLGLHRRLSCRTVFDLDTHTAVTSAVLERLVRAVDTALANVEQNAPAAFVVVAAECDEREVRVSVRDDGPGFDPAQVVAGFGIGAILGHHLDDVGGRGHVTSAPGRGTEVTIVVPRQPPAGARVSWL
ncbi:MAG: hypothetical protein QG597_1932 [Actinomycetota bacterium]|nr:hypothetical protein [Actinomycetota bacterium]